MLIISYDPLHNHWKMCFWQRMLWIYKTLVSFSPGPTQVIFQGSLESHTPICCLVANLCLTETPWTGAHQAPLSMGFPRQEYWNGLPFLSPGALPDPEIEPGSLVLQADLYHLSDQRRPTDSEWSEVAQSCPTLPPRGLQPTRLLPPWDSPGKSTGVGCHCLLQVRSSYFCLPLLILSLPQHWALLLKPKGYSQPGVWSPPSPVVR